MRVNAKKIIQRLELLYPQRLAESWDNVGLQLGSDSRAIERILICLEVTQKVVDEAIAKNIDLIIAHHPLIFKGIKTLAENTPKGKCIATLIRENMLVYCMHTNFDSAEGGLNDILAKRLDLEHIAPLNALQSEKLFKLAVFLPAESLVSVQDALYTAGAGKLGNYAHCGFTSAGTGSFMPLQGANPSIGTVGDTERVSEIKLETVVPQSLVGDVIQALMRVHPYETPAYDLFELKTPAKVYGLGRVGQLSASMSVEDFVAHLKKSLGLTHVRLAHPAVEKKWIKKVAVVSGAGMDYAEDAVLKGADVFVTGDVKYHEAIDVLHHGMLLADVGHFESEVIYKYHLKEVLEAMIKEQDYDLVVEVSTEEAPTFVFA